MNKLDEAPGVQVQAGSTSSYTYQNRGSDGEVNALMRQVGIISAVLGLLVVNAASIHCAPTWSNFISNKRHRATLLIVNAVICIILLCFVVRIDFTA